MRRSCASRSTRRPGELTGTQRELARARGAGAVDRAALADQVAAVLGRDPVAVAGLRGQLTARRDAAAAALAFELAARLQQEVEGLDWVTAAQRVTRPDPADHDACGWSDGTLVRFAVRAGQLTGWTQRACGAETGRRHLAATPPAWRDFAQRNAELAAQLQQAGLQQAGLQQAGLQQGDADDH